MNTVRPSILNRPQKSGSRHGAETADDAWIKEEKRLEARRARLASYEKEFRVTHTHQTNATERKDRIDSLSKAHDMILKSHNALKQKQHDSDMQFARSQEQVLKIERAEEAARQAARRQAAVNASKLNEKIAEEKRQQKVVQKKKEDAVDNAMIQDSVNRKRTFLF